MHLSCFCNDFELCFDVKNEEAGIFEFSTHALEGQLFDNNLFQEISKSNEI